MKQEQVIELAIKACILHMCIDGEIIYPFHEDYVPIGELDKFAKLIEQATIERAAQACEQSEAYRGSVFAARIRALKEDA